MNASIQSFVAGFPSFFIFFAVAAGLVLIGVIIYVLVSPIKELNLMRQGNASAGLGFGGVILGLSIPIAACLATSISIFDLIIWGIVALLLQLLSFSLVDLILKDLPRRIENDEAGAAVVLMTVKLSVAILLAAALSDPALSQLQ